MSSPFRRILIAYDGSEPSERALAFAMALGRKGAALDVVHFVDESRAIAQSSTIVGVFDPTPIIDELDHQGEALLESAHERCRAAGVDVTTALVHDRPVPGIAAIAEKNGDELVVVGTHARSGLPRAFLGSTAEGVLRTELVPVLVLTAGMTPPEAAPFQNVLVAVDDSAPADAAAAFAGRLARTLGSRCELCHVIDAHVVREQAAVYGYDPAPFLEQMRAHAEDVFARARAGAGLDPAAMTTTIVEGEPGRAIIPEAIRCGADAIVIGSHGRRGLQRLVLGSVAEYVVRHSPVPVMVVRK